MIPLDARKERWLNWTLAHIAIKKKKTSIDGQCHTLVSLTGIRQDTFVNVSLNFVKNVVYLFCFKLAVNVVCFLLQLVFFSADFSDLCKQIKIIMFYCAPRPGSANYNRLSTRSRSQIVFLLATLLFLWQHCHSGDSTVIPIITLLFW